MKYLTDLTLYVTITRRASLTMDANDAYRKKYLTTDTKGRTHVTVRFQDNKIFTFSTGHFFVRGQQSLIETHPH